MKWKKSKYDAVFSIYTSGEYEIVQSQEGLGWQVNKSGQYLASCDSLKESKEFAEEHERFN